VFNLFEKLPPIWIHISRWRAPVAQFATRENRIQIGYKNADKMCDYLAEFLNGFSFASACTNFTLGTRGEIDKQMAPVGEVD
jgi:hypothetical protein